MSYPLRMLDEASDDIFDVTIWYEQCRIGLGDRFLEVVYQAFQSISEFPTAVAPFDRGVRERILKHFPYVVRYRFDGKSVVVLAVSHASRDSSAWEDRLED